MPLYQNVCISETLQKGEQSPFPAGGRVPQASRAVQVPLTIPQPPSPPLHHVASQQKYTPRLPGLNPDSTNISSDFCVVKKGTSTIRKGRFE